MDVNGPPEQWRYYIEYLTADASQQTNFLQQIYPSGKWPPYAIQSVLPRLNQLGEKGWELVQMQPVKVGSNGDVQVAGDAPAWTNVYLCVFKQRKS